MICLFIYLPMYLRTHLLIYLLLVSFIFLSISPFDLFVLFYFYLFFFSRESATLLVPLLQYIATPHMTFQVSRKRLVGSVINLPGEKSNSALLLNQLQKAWLMEAFFHIGYINKRYKCTDQAESFLYVFFSLNSIYCCSTSRQKEIIGYRIWPQHNKCRPLTFTSCQNLLCLPGSDEVCPVSVEEREAAAGKAKQEPGKLLLPVEAKFSEAKVSQWSAGGKYCMIFVGVCVSVSLYFFPPRPQP